MVSHLMIGSNINASKIINTFANSGVNYKTYDGTKAKIDCAILDLPNNSNVVIYSHGKIYNDLHILFLCTSLVTKNSFEEISKNKALNIELFCCYSGTAINDLPKNSKLITLTASDHPLIEDFRDELSINAFKLNYYNNFFIKFASYLFMNPETNKFAINSNRLGNSVFVSDINSLVEFTWKLKNIKKWQRGQLENFINFCKKIKHDQKQSDSNDITQLIKLYEDDELLSNWLSQFNLKRYQEIFFISMSYYANLKVMKNLLKIDVDINAKTNTNNTALHIALQKGHKDVVVGLLNDGVDIDINIKNSDGWTALHYASNAGDQLLVADLLKRGADIHAKHILGYTALHIASRQGHQPVVAELLNNGADINSKSPKGLTSLHLASEQGHQDVVIELLKNNADINVKTNSGFTALHFASQNGHHAVADELLKNKADISIKDNEGNTALHIASYKEDKYLVVKLLKSGVNLEFNTEIKLLKNEIKNLFGKKSSVYKEINLYSSSPVEYVLTHNDKAKAAISAIKNIENNLDFADYKKLQNCLEAQSVDVSLDLNDLCGKNGSYYLLYSEL